MQGTKSSPHEACNMFDISTFLTDTQIVLATAGVAFTAGVVLSQRIKDLAKGVPSELRSALGDAETSALSDIKAEYASLKAEAVAKFLPNKAKAPVVVAGVSSPAVVAAVPIPTTVFPPAVAASPFPLAPVVAPAPAAVPIAVVAPVVEVAPVVAAPIT